MICASPKYINNYNSWARFWAELYFTCVGEAKSTIILKSTNTLLIAYYPKVKHTYVKFLPW